MINAELPAEQRSVTVAKQPIEVVLSEDGSSPLSLVLPPDEDMAEMSALRATHFSISDFSLKYENTFREAFEVELARMERRSATFGKSATYLNRLANLASFAGQPETESKYLRAAAELTTDEYPRTRLGENLISVNKLAEAEAVFSQLDLSSNVHANLRLAAFHALRDEFSAAEGRVKAALQIDPLDFGARLFEGALRLISGRYEEAIVSFKIAGESRLNSPSLLNNLAIAYGRINRRDKAFRCLKKAVAIDPLNRNSVVLLADIAHAEGRYEEAIPGLRYYVRFEQKDPAVWARLGQSLLELGQVDEAIAAWKRQGSIEDISSVWNNLGVAYQRRNDPTKALESFKRAMSMSGQASDPVFCLAGKNAAALMLKLGKAREALKLTLLVHQPANHRQFLAKKSLAGIFAVELEALRQVGRSTEATDLGEALLHDPDSSAHVRLWAASALLAMYSFQESRRHRALEIAETYSTDAWLTKAIDEDLRLQLINNIGYVFADNGQVERAEHLLRRASQRVHKDAYITATFGLLHLRKHHLERASDLYAQAALLAKSPADKARIKQKWNYELAILLLETEPNKARRLLQRAADEKDGEKFLQDASNKLLTSVRQLGR